MSKPDRYQRLASTNVQSKPQEKMRDPIRYVDAYGADSQGYESPKQPNIQYVSGGKLQSFYNSSGELIYQVPLGTKLPKGAKITDVTYSKNETGESVADISYLTLEQQKTLEELEGDASKWEQSGFGEFGGRYIFPELPKDAQLIKAEEITDESGSKQLKYSYTQPNQQQIIPTESQELDQSRMSLEQLRLSNIASAFKPIREYNQAVAVKESEFMKLTPEQRVSEVKRLMPEAFTDIGPLPEGVTISDAQFKGGQLIFSFDTSQAEQQLIKAKESEFMKLTPEQRVSEVKRLMPEAFTDVSEDQYVSDVKYQDGELSFTVKANPRKERYNIDPTSPIPGNYFDKTGKVFSPVDLPKDVKISKITEIEPLGPFLPDQDRSPIIMFTTETESKQTVQESEFTPLPQDQTLRRLNTGPVESLFRSLGIEPLELPITGTKRELDVGYYDGQVMTRGMAEVKADPVGYAVKSVGQDVAVLTAGVGGLTIKGLFTTATTGAVVDVAVSQGVKFVSGQGWLTEKELAASLAYGAIFNVGFSGLSKVGGYVYRSSGLATSKIAYRMHTEIAPVFRELNPITAFRGYVTERVTQSYLASASSGVIWKRTVTEKFLMRVTRTRPVLARGFVSVPDSTVAPTKILPSLNVKTGTVDAVKGESLPSDLAKLKWFQPKQTPKTSTVKTAVDSKPHDALVNELSNSTVFSEEQILAKSKSLGRTWHYKELGRGPTRTEVIAVLTKEAAEEPERRAFLAAFSSSFKVSDAKGNIVMPKDEYDLLMSIRAKAPINKPLLPSKEIIEAQDAAWDLSVSPKSSGILFNRTVQDFSKASNTGFIIRGGAGIGTTGTASVITYKNFVAVEQKSNASNVMDLPKIPKDYDSTVTLEKNMNMNINVPSSMKVETENKQSQNQTVIGSTVSRDYVDNQNVPSILERVAPFPGTQNRSKYDEETDYYLSVMPLSNSLNLNLSTVKYDQFNAAFNIQQPIQTPRNINIQNQLPNTITSYLLNQQLDAGLKSVQFNQNIQIHSPLLDTKQSIDTRQIQFNVPIQTFGVNIKYWYTPKIPNFSRNVDFLFDGKRGKRNGKYKKGIWEFEIMEGKDVLKEFF